MGLGFDIYLGRCSSGAEQGSHKPKKGLQGSPRQTCNPFFISSFTLSLTSVRYPRFGHFWTPDGHHMDTTWRANMVGILW